MNKQALRLRMFAGPNGSGKSTFKSIIRPELLGIFVNPDEIEREIKSRDFLNLESYGVQTTEKEVLDFFANSQLLRAAKLIDETDELRYNNGKLNFFNSRTYLAGRDYGWALAGDENRLDSSVVKKSVRE